MIIFFLKYWFVFLSLLASTSFVTLLAYTSNPWIALSSAGVYLLILGAIFWARYRSHRSRITVAIGVALCVVGYTGLYLLIESATLRLLVGVLHVASVSAVYYIPTHFAARLAHEYKPWRRMYVSVLSMAVFAVVATLYGLSMFFQKPGLWLYACLIGVVCGGVSYAIFRLYQDIHTHSKAIWAMVVGYISLQMAWVLGQLSFGYFVLALVHVWLWYMLVVLVRFHLSAKGIIWNKQYRFLFFGILGIVLLLVFAQWL